MTFCPLLNNVFPAQVITSQVFPLQENFPLLCQNFTIVNFSNSVPSESGTENSPLHNFTRTSYSTVYTN